MNIPLLVWEPNLWSCQCNAVVHITQLWSLELISEVVFSYCSNVWWKPTCMHVWFGNMAPIWYIWSQITVPLEWMSECLLNYFWMKKKKWWQMQIWHSEDCASWYILIMIANGMHYFSDLFDEVLYIFQTCPLFIIRSISTLYTCNRYLSF
jgi:hypothetical protein